VTDRLSSRSTADRAIGNYDQPPSIVWCGSLARSRTVRAVWNAGGERRYSRVLASVRFVSRRFPSSFRYRQEPRRVSCTSIGLASQPPRMLTPLVTHAAHWRSLNQDVPTSDVPCRLAGTTQWLQATLPLPSHATLLRFERVPDSPVRPRPPRVHPVKDLRKGDPERLPSYREPSRCSRPVTALLCASSGRI